MSSDTNMNSINHIISPSTLNMHLKVLPIHLSQQVIGFQILDAFLRKTTPALACIKSLPHLRCKEPIRAIIQWTLQVIEKV